MKGARFVVLVVSILALGFVLFATKPWTVAALAEERAAAGEKSLLAHDVARGLWFGFLGTAIAGAMLIGTWKHWCRRLPAPARTTPISSEGLGRPMFYLLLIGAVGLGAWVRWGFSHRGLWWDELWSVRHASLGYLKPVGEPEDENFRFLKRDWQTTIWEYRKPTNHAQVSIASRVSQSIWRKQTGAEPHEFNAFAVRLPSFLAALGAILAIGILVRRWGFSIGGIAAALLLALHPWYMRYGAEARGYSFAVLWTVLGCLWLTLAVTDEQGRWRYWLLFGLNQMLITWCLPNGFFYAAAFTAAGVLLALRRWTKREHRIAILWRLFTVNVMAAMIFLPIFMPNVLQALRWGEINDTATLTWPRFQDTLTQLAFGMNRSTVPGEGGAGIPSLDSEASASPMGVWPTLILIGMGLVIGAFRLGRARPGAAMILGSVLLGVMGSLIITKIGGQFFYHRYIIYAIVPFVVLFGIGLAGISRAMTKRAGVAVFVGLAALGLYLYTTRDARALLFTRPYAPYEEVAQHLQSRVSKDKELRVIGYGLGGRMMGMYFPRTRFAKNKADLSREMVAASSRGVPYVIVLGYDGVNHALPEYRDGFEILDRPNAFIESRHFNGIEPMFYFRILEPLPEAGPAALPE